MRISPNRNRQEKRLKHQISPVSLRIPLGKTSKNLCGKAPQESERLGPNHHKRAHLYNTLPPFPFRTEHFSSFWFTKTHKSARSSSPKVFQQTPKLTGDRENPSLKIPRNWTVKEEVVYDSLLLPHLVHHVSGDELVVIKCKRTVWKWVGYNN
jgi:hypothetical protein